MSVPILRDIVSYDFQISIFLISIVLLVLSKILFPFQFKSLLSSKLEGDSVNIVWVGVLINLSFILMISGLSMPFVSPKIQGYFSNSLYLYLFLSFCLLFYIAVKNLFIGLFFLTLDDFDKFSLLISDKIVASFYKYIILVLLLLIFYFTPFEIQNKGLIFIIVVGVIYGLEWFYELIMEKNVLKNNYLYKMLYICTLEILPLFVWIKLFF